MRLRCLAEGLVKTMSLGGCFKSATCLLRHRMVGILLRVPVIQILRLVEFKGTPKGNRTLCYFIYLFFFWGGAILTHTHVVRVNYLSLHVVFRQNPCPICFEEKGPCRTCRKGAAGTVFGGALKVLPICVRTTRIFQAPAPRFHVNA